MAKKPAYNLKLAVVKRFLRALVPQVVLYAPVAVRYAEEMKEVLPVWVIPGLIFLSSVFTALDKLIREIKK
jgi:hypothetical protein